MKKRSIIFLILTVSSMLMSCNNNLEADVFIPQQDEIYFGPKLFDISTKAVSETTGASLEANGFKAAVLVDSDNSVMFNKAVSYNAGVYTVQGETYYYPVSGTISAYAVYPKTEVITINDGNATITYSQNAAEDLVIARVSHISKRSEAVNIDFAHALSQATFKVKGTDTGARYALKSIEVTAPNGGTYRYSDGAWVSPGAATAYTVYSNAGATVSTGSFQAFGESMTFIPGEVRVRVQWECWNTSSGIKVAEYNQSANVNLSKGNHSIVKLSLPNSSAEPILFTTTVEEWGADEINIELSDSSD